MSTTHYDYIVVGAGAAGAVIASRLSEDRGRSVLLLEAGPEAHADAAMQAAVLNASQPAVVPGLNWKIPTWVRGEAPGAGTWDYEAGRVVGGSSAVNTVQALRGMPADFDEWAEECGPDWSWSRVLPYFRALEDDPLGPDALHGRGGPLPIRRERREELTQLQAALRKACIAHGFAETADHNNPAATGVGMIPKNAVDGVRVSAAMAYLAPARARANLTVLAGAHVHRLIWDGRRCGGVEARLGGEIKQFRAEKIVLCAGVVHTPAILMRSGVGNPALLEPLGIRAHLPLAGVGEGLMDHPSVGIWGVPRPGVCALNENLHQTLLRHTSGASGHTNDLHLRLMAGIHAPSVFPSRLSTMGLQTVAGVVVCLTKSRSRGHVRIVSADPCAAPAVALNLLGDRRDIAPLLRGVRLAWQLAQHHPIRSLFDGFLGWTEGVMRSDVALERAITSYVRPSSHLSGSARMGRSPDAGAVVDPEGLVFGADNLWIGDASIMPVAPSAPPHLSCLMVAEKIAAELSRERV